MSDRLVVITGASSGIGAATAQRFLSQGDRVLNLDTSPVGAPDGCFNAAVDVRDWEAVRKAVDDAVRRFGPVQVGIANAGVSRRRDVLATTRESMADVIDVNLLGVFGLWQACARHMLLQGGGVLLATASTNGTVGYPYYSDYNASKAGVLSLCRSFALELSPIVRVACVSPGYVLTPMQRAEYSDAMLAEVDSRLPMKRHAMPEEIANAFYFLASSDASYITGQQLVVDGGEVAGGTASDFGTFAARAAESSEVL